MAIKQLDSTIITTSNRLFQPAARVAIFAVYFWFGILKLFGLSPASPLASALVARTVGSRYFHALFIILALYECLVGVLFLFPKATRVVIPLLLIHMVIVCSPLFLAPHLAWTRAFVPTLEGQYIIKNMAIIALAIGIAAGAKPLRSKRRLS